MNPSVLGSMVTVLWWMLTPEKVTDRLELMMMRGLVLWSDARLVLNASHSRLPWTGLP